MDAILSALGLSRNEIKIYISLTKFGLSSAGQISKKSKIHRRNVYDALERLIWKGMASFVMLNGKKFFKAADPSRLVFIIEEEKSRLNKLKNSVKALMPTLKAHPASNEDSDVQHFRGYEGIKTVYEDIIKTSNNYIGYGPGIHEQVALKPYFKHYFKKIEKAGLQIRVIWNESSRGKYFTKIKGMNSRYFANSVSSYLAMRVYGTKVAIILLSKEEPMAILINNKTIANEYKNYFEIMWEAAKR